MDTIAIDITRAKAIDGFMSEPELLWLAAQAREHSVIVEIGSYLGRSTRAMLDHTNGIIYAIDDWKGPRDIYLSKEERDTLFSKFCANLKDSLNWDNLITLHLDFAMIPNWILFGTNDQVDMVFIDGDHNYEYVKRDILFWKNKLSKGGLICGHDINFPEVRLAVTELLMDYDVAENTSIWYKHV